jgi:ribosomal protein S18 acetylase RimI-like enzyme
VEFSILKSGNVIHFRRATLADSPALGQVQVTSWRSAFRGIAPNDYLDHQANVDNQVEDWKKILADDAQLVFVVENEQHLIGYAWAQREKNPDIEWDSELISMHLLPDYKRQGIGKKLFSTVSAELQRQGCTSIYLWVFEDNRSARFFYEALGGKLAGKQEITLGGKNLIEVVYSWKDISKLSRQ